MPTHTGRAEWQPLRQAPHRLGFAMAMVVLIAQSLLTATAQLTRRPLRSGRLR
jgi:hypothetical protein